MKYLSTLIKEGSFVPPSDEEIEKMDLIDVRRNVMKWCQVSNGAIGPCRECKHKCKAGKWAIELYDRTAVPKTGGPEVSKTISDNKKVDESAEREEIEMPAYTDSGSPTAEWYIAAYASGNPVGYCQHHFNLSIQKAKKKLYMYEYNHFGKLKNKTKTEESPRIQNPAIELQQTEVDEDFSLKNDLVQKKEALIKIQEQYKAQLDDLNEKLRKVTNQIDAIAMCLELIE